MKNHLVVFVFAIFLGANAIAAHHCAVAADIQVYDAKTFQFKRVEHGVTQFFDVSSQPHEDPKILAIQGSSGAMGSASVWTGTLVGAPEGDVIQAHASFQIKDQRGDASLAFSLDSTFSKTTITLETTAGSEYFLMPVDLKCMKLQ